MCITFSKKSTKITASEVGGGHEGYSNQSQFRITKDSNVAQYENLLALQGPRFNYRNGGREGTEDEDGA